MKKIAYIFLSMMMIFYANDGMSAVLEGEEIIELDTIIQRITDCDTEAEVCLDVVFANLRDYEIMVDGSPYDGRFPACNIDTIYKANFDNVIDGSQAPYELLFFEANNTNFQITFNTFRELVDSIQQWDPISNWMYDSMNNEMISINPTEINFGNRIEFRDANNNTTILMINQTFVANGTFFFFDQGWSEMVLIDTVNSCIDTVDIGVYCGDIDTTFLQADFDIIEEYCFEDLDLLGNIVEINDLLNPDLDHVEIVITANCILYRGLSNGMDTLFYEVCDDIVICDTNYIIIEIINAPENLDSTIFATLYPNQSDTFCFDLSYPLDSIYNACEDLSGTEIAFTIDTATNCLIYEYLSVGVDTACIVLEYENDIRDSFTFIVNGSLPELEVIYDTIYVSQSNTYCLDETQLGDTIQVFEEYCGNTLGFISFTTSDTAGFCVEYTGEISNGTDTLCLRICDQNDVCDTTILIISTIDNFGISETFSDSILINFTDTLCFENDLPGDIADIENICPELSGSSVTFEVDTISNCIYYTGNLIGVDTACILITDEFGNTDTNFVLITTLYPKSDTTYVDIELGATDTICIDLSELAGDVNTMLSVCPESINEDVMIDWVQDTCIEYTGVNANAQDTMCIVSCDDLGVCDTSIIIFNVLDTLVIGRMDTVIFDSILINFTESYCFDTLEGNGPVVSITNECPDQSGDVEFFLDEDNYCLSFTGDSIGVDTACIRIEYENGFIDSIGFIVEVIPPTPETINVLLQVGESDTICLDLSELAGFPDEESMVDFCEDLNGINAQVDLDTSDLCVEITGLEEGVDSSCIVICDNFDVCDTTYFIITVQDTTMVLDSLVANDDVSSTDVNDDVVINILGNDIIPDNTLDSIFILTDPLNGTVSLDENGFATYLPDFNFCGLDSFEYVICNAIECDTAQVVIEVICEEEPEELFIPQGFSPNGDNIGDVWVIRGLDQFPNTNVMVYNRWGNRVYESNNYQNDWDGSWEDNPLPDGTYFYLIDFRNGEDPKSGYVVILR